jgi:hypothetical protein
VRNPATAFVRCKQFEFTAALVNVQYRSMVGKLMMPVMLYQPAEGLQTVVARLKTLASLRRPN